MRSHRLAWVAIGAAILLCPSRVQAQDLPEFEIGLKPFGTYHGGAIDNVSIANGNLTVDIPLFSYPQRGGKLTAGLAIVYNNKGWKFVTRCNRWTGECTTSVHWMGNGVTIVDPQSFSGGGMTCAGYSGGTVSIGAAVSGLGDSHAVGDTGLGYYESIDGSGIRYDPTNSIYTDRNGIRNWWSWTAPVQREDPNGNQILGNLSTLNITDTLGRQIPLVSTSSDSTGCPVGERAVAGAGIFSLPGPGGGTSQIKVCNVSVPLSTNFAGADTQYSGNVGMIQSVVLYNGTSWSTSQAWSFQYDSRDPGDPSSINYGDLTQIAFPTGGTISYTWASVADINQPSRYVTSRTVNANDSTGPHTWNYGSVGWSASPQAVTVTDPLGNDSVYTVTYLGSGQSGYVTQAQYYQGSHTSGTLLKTETTDYTYTSVQGVNCSPLAAVFNVQAIRVTTSWPNGKVSKVETDYDVGSFTFKNPNPAYTTTFGASFGQVLAKRHYDYGSGAPGALLSQTVNAYMAAGGSAYQTYNMLDLLSSVTVKDGSGNQAAYTFYGYDESSLQSSGVTTQHDGSPPNGNTRGNQTSVHRWLSGSTVSTNNCPVSVSNGYLVSSSVYYDTGTVSQSTDPCGHATSFLYSSTYVGAYPTTITNALNQSTTNSYDFNIGLLASTTDPNSQTTSFGYDSLFRLTQKTFPDGGQTSFTYQDSSLPFSVTVTKAITSSLNLNAKAVVDGVGRVSQAQLLSDPDGNDYIDTTYDAAGHKATVSNPYRSMNDPTYGVTTFQYDGLSRTTKLIPPDGSSSSNNIVTAYSDNCTTVTDQANKIRKSCTDGLGRLTQVFEPDSSNSLVNETDYQYDALGNLTRVDQKGNTTDSTKWRTRTFVYDSLSQLTSSSNPESGPITNGYDADGNMVTKTDARSITVTYTYEKLHRLTGKTYSNGDTAVSYAYDQTNCLGQPACYNIGHRTSMTDAGGSQAWAYDKMGRALTDQRTTNSVTKNTVYTYNLDGSIATLTYPSRRVITYTPGGAARPLSAVDNANSINYATAAHYAPQGALSSLANGASLISTFYYNSRLQPCRISAQSSGTAPLSCTDTGNIGNVLDFTYNFSLGTADNGTVMGITNNRDNTRSQTFAYDTLNRLATAQTTSTYSTSPAHCWGESFGYDIWTNLQTISVSSSSYNGCTQENLSVTAGGNNRITTSGYGYL